MNKDILPKYIELEVKKIIKTYFNIENIENLDKYSTFLTQERLDEIHFFRGYKLLSTHVYNFIYLYLLNEKNIDKHLIIDSLKNEVEFNKAEIELIKKNSWGFNDYINSKYKDEVEHITNENKDKNKDSNIKNHSKNIKTIQNEVISFDKYVFCTNCGLSIYGFSNGSIFGSLGCIACTCRQKNQNIYYRSKNYCGICGKSLNSQYCGYCGIKNY